MNYHNTQMKSTIHDEYETWQADSVCDGCSEQTHVLYTRLCGHRLCSKCNVTRECQVCIDLFTWNEFTKDLNINGKAYIT